jgi:CBS domain containing-hemolysin-like protein
VSASDIPLLVLAALLLVVAAVLAAAEVAQSRVSRVAVEEFLRDDRRAAQRLARIVADPAPYIALVLLIRKLCELSAACLVTVAVVHAQGSGWATIALAAFVITGVDYVMVGVAARTLARQHAGGVALHTAGLVTRMTAIFGPLPKTLILLGNALTPGKGYREGPFASEAELRDLVDLAEESDVIERSERDMIASVFELGDTLAREVMVPRTDMVFIERHKTVRQALELALRSGFSRIPVVGEGVDDVVGITFLKDLVRREHEGRGDKLVDTTMRPTVFVPDTKPADDLLREMQAQRTHLVIVIDEYGGTAGLVTIEDVLEEIVGEITDEYDVETPPVSRIDDRTVRVVARLPVHDLAEIFDQEIPNEDEVDTVGGLLASALGRVPIPGARVKVAGLTLTAESAAGRRNRIGTVLVRQEQADETTPTALQSDEQSPTPAPDAA